MFWATSVLGKRIPAFGSLVPLYVETIKTRAGHLDHRQLTNVIWACANANLTQELLQEMMPPVRKRIVAIADGLDGRQVSNIMWATAKLRSKSPDLLNALPVMAEMVERRVSDMTPQGVANSLWAVATLKDDAPLLLQIAPRFVAALIARAERSNPQVVANSIWAIAKLRDSSKELREALPALVDAAGRRAPEMNAQDVVDIIWATAALRNDAPVLARLLPSLVAQLPRVSRQLSPQHVANVGRMLRAVLPRAQEVLPMCTALDIQMLCHGLAACEYRDAACLKSISRAVIRMGPTLQGKDAGLALSTIAWAFARLDARSMAMLRTIADITSTMLPKLGDWNLCALVWSYHELDTGDKFAAFRARLEAEVARRGIPAHLVDRSSLGPEHWRSKA